MKRTKKFLSLLLFSVMFFSIEAAINFGSPQSFIKVSTGGRLHLTEDISGVDGSVVLNSDGEITGETNKKIGFSSGVLESNQTEMTLSGDYDPNSGKYIRLNGSDSLRAEPGAVLENLEITGAENRLLGQPIFVNPIVFGTDPNTSLTVAINSKLNQNIELNNGTLFLEQDLRLCDDVTLVGNGRLKLNKKTFAFGGKELTLANNIFWENASDEELNGKLNLSGVQQYSGISVLNGNGNILDLTTGGTIMIQPDSTLYLTDIVVKGLGDGFLVFGNEESKVIMSETTVELATSYTTTIGKIHVEGPTTFILEDNFWHFDEKGSLTVDGVVLFTDRRGTPTTQMGYVTFGDPAENHFSSIDSGTIKAVAYLEDFDLLNEQIINNAIDIDNLEEKVTNNSYAIVADHDLTVENSHAILNINSLIEVFPLIGILTTNITFSASAHLDPDESITVAENITINGNGSMVVFSNPDEPQFIVQPGKCVTLQNMNLQNVNNKTFQLGSCSCVKIGPNVTFGITEDVEFKGKFEIVEGTFTIYGVGGIRRVGFGRSFCDKCAAPGRDARRDFDGFDPLNIDGNTLSIKNIEIIRVEDITNNEDGQIRLCGETIVNFYQNCKLKFLVEGIENIFRLRNNNLSLTGKLNFGEKEHNKLHIVHKAPEEMTTSPYTINFGDNFAYLNSVFGVAELIFDDDVVRVINGGLNAFVTGNNSFIGGRQLQIWDNPIRQISDNFDQADDLVITTNLSSATETAEGFYEGSVGDAPLDQEFVPGLVGYVIEPDGSTRQRVFRSPFITIDEDIYKNNIVDLKDAFGEICLEETVAKNFVPHKARDLTLRMKNSIVNTGIKEVVVKKGDKIIVEDGNNVVRVSGKFKIDGELKTQGNANLVFEAENFDSKVCISKDALVWQDSNIEFRCNVEIE